MGDKEESTELAASQSTSWPMRDLPLLFHMHTQTPQGTSASRTLSKDHFVPARVGLESAYPRVLGFFYFSWKWYLGRGDGIPLEQCGFAFIHEGLFQRNSIGITPL